jgi:hypothetical protein
MEKVTVGQRVTITCQGLTVTGTVLSADHEIRYEKGMEEVIGYLLEVRSDEGQVHYWKSLIDGGNLTIHDSSSKVFEVRLRYGFDEDTLWESIASHEYRCQTDEQAHNFCQVLLQSNDDIAEIRWNWKGSLQGHYPISEKAGQQA